MGKKGGASKKRAAGNKNSKVLDEMLSGVKSILGRVEKNLGNSGFQVTIKNKDNEAPKTVQGLARGVFKGGSRNSATFISPGAFVILADAVDPIGGGMTTHEIIGVINSRKEYNLLKEKDMIPGCLMDQKDSGDDAFEFVESDEESEEVEDEDAARAKKESARVTAGRRVERDVELDEL